MSWRCGCCYCCWCLPLHKFNSNDIRPTIGWKINMRQCDYTNKCSISKMARAVRCGQSELICIKMCNIRRHTCHLAVKSLEKFVFFSPLFYLFESLLLLSTGKTIECHLIRLTKTSHNASEANQIDADDGHSKCRKFVCWIWIYNEPRFVLRTQLSRIHRSFCVCVTVVNCFVGIEILCVSHTKHHIQWFAGR